MVTTLQNAVREQLAPIRLYWGYNNTERKVLSSFGKVRACFCSSCVRGWNKQDTFQFTAMASNHIQNQFSFCKQKNALSYLQSLQNRVLRTENKFIQ